MPYLYHSGGGGKSELAKRITKLDMELSGVKTKYDASKSAYENWKVGKKTENPTNQDLTGGFDYETFFKETFRIMKTPNMFVWCSKLQIRDLLNEIAKYPVIATNILVWCKTNAIPTANNIFLNDVEYCIHVRGKGVVFNNSYELKSKFYVSPINAADKKHYNHPAIKPLNLVSRHIKLVTKENDIVLDPFVGSGTTCVAAKEANRRYIGIEIDDEYYKTAVDRVNGYDSNGQMNIFSDFK